MNLGVADVRAALPEHVRRLAERVRRGIIYHVSNACAQSPHLDRDDLIRCSLTAVWATACSPGFYLSSSAATYLGMAAKRAIQREVYFLSWAKESRDMKRSKWVLRVIGQRVREHHAVRQTAIERKTETGEAIRWLRLLARFGTLTRREARVCILSYVFGYEQPEIAKKLGTTNGTIGTTRHRALEALRLVAAPSSFDLALARKSRRKPRDRRSRTTDKHSGAEGMARQQIQHSGPSKNLSEDTHNG